MITSTPLLTEYLQTLKIAELKMLKLELEHFDGQLEGLLHTSFELDKVFDIMDGLGDSFPEKKSNILEHIYNEITNRN